MLPKASSEGATEKRSTAYRKLTTTEEMELTQKLTRQSVRNTRVLMPENWKRRKSTEEIDKIVNRLTKNNHLLQADSRRVATGRIKQMGDVVNSYAWKGYN